MGTETFVLLRIINNVCEFCKEYKKVTDKVLYANLNKNSPLVNNT